MGKKRFGVALSKELVNELDILVRYLNMDRSKIVEQAVREFLCEYKHYLKSHECVGVLLVFSTGLSRSSDVVDDFKDVVLAYNHHHVGECCIETIVLKGSSEAISRLHKKLLNSNCRCHFIPFHNISCVGLNDKS